MFWGWDVRLRVSGVGHSVYVQGFWILLGGFGRLGDWCLAIQVYDTAFTGCRIDVRG